MKKKIEAVALDPYMAVKEETDNDPDTVYYSAWDKPFVLEGLAFARKGSFRRMPANSKKLPLSIGVDRFADQSSGVMLRFKTTSPFVKVRAKVRVLNNSADIMRMGRMGFDIYAGKPEASGYVGMTRMNFDTVKYPEHSYAATMIDRPNPGNHLREFQINFPLYAEVLEFAVGLKKGSVIEKPTPRKSPKKIVLYGTSVDQGCCAARPGLGIANTLSRKLNMEVICLGFSGSAKGEPEIAKIMAQIPDAALYIVGYDGNVDLDRLENTLTPFCEILRKKRPETPLLTFSLMKHPREFPLDEQDDSCFEERARRTAIHTANIRHFLDKGDREVHFLDGTMLYGSDFTQCAMDSGHPNDIGLQHCAEAMAAAAGCFMKA